MNGDNVPFNVGEELDIAVDVPFTKTYSQLESLVSEKIKQSFNLFVSGSLGMFDVFNQCTPIENICKYILNNIDV